MTTGSRTKNRQSKAEQARQTRQRILEAATALFVRDGFQSTTMAAVAADAGVAVQTLYLSFRNKTAILGAAFDLAVIGDGDGDDTEPVTAFVGQADGPTALFGYLADTGRVIRRAAPLYEVLQAAAGDPEVAELLRANQRERYATFSAMATTLAAKPGFATGLGVEDAAAVLYALQSPETFLLLVHQHEWSADQWQDWVCRTLLAQLFPSQVGREPSPPRPRSGVRARLVDET